VSCPVPHAGPTKWEKLAEFLKDTYPTIANEVGVYEHRAHLQQASCATAQVNAHTDTGAA
jgi:hypothetical protein